MRGLLLFAVLILLILVMGTSYGMADYIEYVKYYDLSRNFIIADAFDYNAALWFHYPRDTGYTMINKIFYDFDVEYQTFKLIYVAMLMGGASYVCYKLSGNLLIVIMLYVLYPFFMDIIQTRTFIVEVILLVAIYMYAIYGSKLEFIIMMLVAASFHSMALLYIPFVFVEKLREIKYLNCIYYFLVIIAVCLPFYASNIAEGVDMLGKLFVAYDGFSHYAMYTTISSRYLYLMGYCFLLVAIGCLFYINKYNHHYVIVKTRFNEVVYNFYVYLFMLSPLYVIQISMMRIPRCAMILLYIIVANIQSSKNIKNRKIILLLTLCIVAVFSYFDLYAGDFKNVEIIIMNNIIMDFFK